MPLYRRKGSRNWWMKFQFEGRTYLCSTKTSSKSLAQKAERVRRREIEAAFNGVPKRRVFRTIAAEANDWMALKRTALAATSLRNIEIDFRLHLIPVLNNRLLTDIDVHTIAYYHRCRLAECASPKSINLEVGTLRALLKHRGLWSEDFKRDYRPLKVRSVVGVALTEEQEENLLQACRTSESPSLLPGVVVALNTGMRLSEVRLLRWRQIDFLKAELTVGDSKTRHGEQRVIPLNGTVVGELQRWATRVPDRADAHFVFPSEQIAHGRVYRRDPDRAIRSWKTAWATAKRRAGLKLRFHDIRHTACTRMLEAGTPLSVVARILGWSPATTAMMAKRYGHIGDSALRQAVAALELSRVKPRKGGYSLGYSGDRSEPTDPVSN